jgi:hypothetical protein
VYLAQCGPERIAAKARADNELRAPIIKAANIKGEWACRIFHNALLRMDEFFNRRVTFIGRPQPTLGALGNGRGEAARVLNAYGETVVASSGVPLER